MAYSEYTSGTHFPHFNASDDVVPPWLYSNDQQCKINAHINCIVVPSSVNNVFQQKGFLRCADIIKFVKIILKLIPFIAAKQGYDTFYAMISEDFYDLLAPFFFKACIQLLGNNILILHLKCSMDI
jgi:hypothetical protein